MLTGRLTDTSIDASAVQVAKGRMMWIAMEMCDASVADVLRRTREPLSEDEICVVSGTGSEPQNTCSTHRPQNTLVDPDPDPELELDLELDPDPDLEPEPEPDLDSTRCLT
jgi:hypothetical protein